jgi:YD repeat-containing protein
MSRQDANGNIITHNQIGTSCSTTQCTYDYVDTLGRTVPSPLAAELSTTTTDYSNCTGPLPISSAKVWNGPGPSGGTTTLKFCFVLVTASSDFRISGTSEASAAGTRLQSVVLPGGNSWTFEYNSVDSYGVNWGDLSKVTLPTGGTISYTYSAFVYSVLGGAAQGRRLLTTRTVNANDGTGPHTWNYAWSPAYTTGTESSAPPTSVVVTDPIGNDTVNTINLYSDHITRVSAVQQYQGSHSGGNLLLTQTTDWAPIGSSTPPTILPVRKTITWANGKTKKVERDFDSSITWYGGAGTASYGDVIAERYYDYGAGSPSAAPLRSVSFNYLALTNPTYASNNLLDLLSSVTVFDGNGYQCSAMSFTYDAQSQLISSGVTTQHGALIGGGVRGNISSATNQLSNNPCSSGAAWTPVTAYTNYFDTGMRASDRDPLGNVTSYVYSSVFMGAYLTQINLPDTSSPNLTHHQINQNYDANTGLLTSYTDQSGNKTTYTYDTLWRLTSATFPPQPEGTGQIKLFYPDANTVEKTENIDGARSTDEFTRFDGIGRRIRRIAANDESSPWDQVDFCYNGRGQLIFKTYPYQGAGLSASQVCSGLGDTYTRDALGRILQIQHSDGTSVQKSYTGSTASVLDEGNGTRLIQRLVQVDGLGRIKSVCEVSNISLPQASGTPGACNQDISGTGFLTLYGYDGLNNLISVSQNGYLPRSFQYDSFSRLRSASNPESGVRTYGYDNDGRLISITSPMPNQTSPSTTVTTTLAYDQLDRLRTKTYTDGSTPGVTINYDETVALGVSGLLNTTGRGSSAYVTNSLGQMLAGEVASYDSRGNVRNDSQCTPQNCGTGIFTVSYTYDLIHDVLTNTNGVGVTLTTSYNRAGRLTSLASSLVDATHPATLVNAVHYNSFGSETTGTLGNNELEQFGYAPRGWVQSLAVGPGTPNGQTYSFGLGFAPDGDIVSGNDSVNGNWTYAYDDFNRLTCANLNNGPCSSPTNGQATYSYSYDRFGNRWNQTGPHTINLSFNGNNNRMDGYSYDAAGNLLNDGTHSYTYDAENRVIQVDGGTTATYVYDASGRRVRQATQLGTVDKIYDFSSREVAEVTSTGTWARGEIYAAGRHLATYSSGNTYFNHSDWLATNRVHTSAAGLVTETCSTLPFGDQMTCSGSESSPLHFTGQEHDMETGLDHFEARYYSS